MGASCPVTPAAAGCGAGAAVPTIPCCMTCRNISFISLNSAFNLAISSGSPPAPAAGAWGATGAAAAAPHEVAPDEATRDVEPVSAPGAAAPGAAAAAPSVEVCVCGGSQLARGGVEWVSKIHREQVTSCNRDAAHRHTVPRWRGGCGQAHRHARRRRRLLHDGLFNLCVGRVR